MVLQIKSVVGFCIYLLSVFTKLFFFLTNIIGSVFILLVV